MDCFGSLSAAIASRRAVALVTVVAAEGRPDLVGRHLVGEAGAVLASEIGDPGLESACLAACAGAIAAEKARTVSVAGGLRIYVEPYLPPPVLVVVGAGHVAQPVAELGSLLGFEVVVIDDRAEYANRERFPKADQILAGPFLPTLRGIAWGSRHHVVLVTRGHHQDMNCLRELVGHPLGYIGMIGSRTRVQTVYKILTEEHGVDPASLEKVHAPIGLDIGARSPAEIAVAVAAELVKVRRGGTGASLSKLRRAQVHGRRDGP